MGTTEAATSADLLRELRAVRDQRDELNSQLSALSGREIDLTNRLRDRMKSDGLGKDGAKLSGEGITVTWREKWRASCAPDKWEEVMRWALATGHGYIFQRRLTDANVMSIVDSGVSLPDGLSVEAYATLDTRRHGGKATENE